ncbi:MAG: acyltransferase family protein [Solirubrobacteraceae bacterium]
MTQSRALWLDYMRSFITVLVVAYHSSLAYTTYAYFNTKTYSLSTHPIVDRFRWIGMDIFAHFNDIFFMSLMFFISGLFVYKNLQLKGPKLFLIDRLKRLGIPFLLGVSIILPLAFFPSFYLSHHSLNIIDYLKDFLLNQDWPIGPPWFLWVLLVFNAISIFIPLNLYSSISHKIFNYSKSPLKLFISLYFYLCLAFIPLSLYFGHYKWLGIGPFDFQVNRILLYFSIYIFGCFLGSGNWEKYFYTNKKLLAIKWTFWLFFCLLSFFITVLFGFNFWEIINSTFLSNTYGLLIFNLLFVLSCLSIIFCFLAIFKLTIHTPIKTLTNLSSCAFGIYLIHYAFITWLQFILLNFSLPIVFKFLCVFFGSLFLSWCFVYFLRRFAFFKQLL